MVNSGINVMVTYIPAGWRAHDKILVKHLSSSEWERLHIFHLVGCQDWPLTAEPMSLCLKIWGGSKDLFGEKCTVSAKRPVSAKPQILRIQLLLIQTMYVASKQGWGHLSEFSLRKCKIDNSMCLRPMDSDSRGEKLNAIHQKYCLPIPPPSQLCRSYLAKETTLGARVLSHQNRWCLFRYVFLLSRPRCPEEEWGCCQHGLQTHSNELLR